MDDDLDPEIKQKFEKSQMSKAGKIAMELSQERKRLKEELAQLQSEVDSAEAEKAHVRLLEQLKLQHDLEIERMSKAHELNMEAFGVTGTNSIATGAKTVDKKPVAKKTDKKSE